MSSDISIPFVKASACGNDFLIIDGQNAPPDMAEFTRRICDRHRGVGADGVEWLFPAKDADIEARLLNADGSQAEISGNGTRCVATYLCSERTREQVKIRTGAGVKVCTLSSRSGTECEFEMAMGVPTVEKELLIDLGAWQVHGIPVAMGNPHYVVFVEEFPGDWQSKGAEIQQQAIFKQGINVEFVRIVDKENIEARFFERGAGETQSSGTGSCASAVAAIDTERAASPVRVHAPGGTQTVRWENHVHLRGSAQLICRGEYFI